MKEEEEKVGVTSLRQRRKGKERDYRKKVGLKGDGGRREWGGLLGNIKIAADGAGMNNKRGASSSTVFTKRAAFVM